MSTEVLSTEAVVAPRPRPGRSLTGAWLLSGAMVVSGVLTYAFHILAARSLGAGAYGEIAVLWGAMFVAAVVLFRPLEQTTSRAIADRRARGQESASVVRAAIVLGTVGAGAILALTGLLAWGRITDQLFAGNQFLTACLFTGIAVYGASYLVRGLLAGMEWFPGYGIGLIADGAGRLVVAAPLVLVASEGLAAAAMVVAGLASAVIPLAIGHDRLRPALEDGPGERFALRAALHFALPATVVAAADQLLVNGAPLLVVVDGGQSAHRAAGIVLAATMLVRAPVYVFQGVAASLLPNLTRVNAVDGAGAVGGALRRLVMLLAAAGVLIVGGTAAIGPEALRTLYGDDFAAGRTELMLIGTGVGFYLVAATFSQALLALDRTRLAAAAWSVAAALFAGLYAALPGSQLMRVAIGFGAGSIVAAALLTTAFARKSGRR